jgi:NurA-like 5'-3' nuclease
MINLKEISESQTEQNEELNTLLDKKSAELPKISKYQSSWTQTHYISDKVNTPVIHQSRKWTPTNKNITKDSQFCFKFQKTLFNQKLKEINQNLDFFKYQELAAYDCFVREVEIEDSYCEITADGMTSTEQWIRYFYMGNLHHGQPLEGLLIIENISKTVK